MGKKIYTFWGGCGVARVEGVLGNGQGVGSRALEELKQGVVAGKRVEREWLVWSKWSSCSPRNAKGHFCNSQIVTHNRQWPSTVFLETVTFKRIQPFPSG